MRLTNLNAYKFAQSFYKHLDLTANSSFEAASTTF